MELILAVAALDQPILPAQNTPQLPSVASVGPAQTSLTHDVPEPPAISSQLPEVCIYCQPYTHTHIMIYCMYTIGVDGRWYGY